VALYKLTFSDADGAEEGEAIAALVNEMLATTAASDIDGYVAIDGQSACGAILFTRLWLANQVNAFILSPVAVHPDCQRQGLGQQLIDHGIGRLGGQGV